jgi:hypothetical protein
MLKHRLQKNDLTQEKVYDNKIIKTKYMFLNKY